MLTSDTEYLHFITACQSERREAICVDSQSTVSSFMYFALWRSGADDMSKPLAVNGEGTDRAN